MIVNLAVGQCLTGDSYEQLLQEKQAVSMILPMYRFQIKVGKGKVTIKRTK